MFAKEGAHISQRIWVVLGLTPNRHPLQEQVVDTFVPNDILVKGGLGVGVEQDEDISSEHDETSFMRETSVVILTGANACGKVRYGSPLTERTPIVSTTECLPQAGYSSQQY